MDKLPVKDQVVNVRICGPQITLLVLLAQSGIDNMSVNGCSFVRIKLQFFSIILKCKNHFTSQVEPKQVAGWLWSWTVLC